MRNHMIKFLLLAAGAGLLLGGCGSDGGSAPGLSSATGIATAPIDDGNPATPAAVFALPAAINADNAIVGAAEAVAGGPLQPAYWLVDNTGAATVAPTAMATLYFGGFAAAHDISGAGVIVGSAAHIDTSIRAVVWASELGVPQTLQALSPGGFASAYGINDAGLIVGTAENGAGLYQAVRWQRNPGTGALSGPFVLPGVPDGWEAEAYAVNDAGTIAGELIDTEGLSRAVLWRLEGASYLRVDLPTPAGFDHALAIDLTSPAGDAPLVVVGEGSDDGLGGLTHAVRWVIAGDSVTVTDLGLNNRASSAAAVNTAGRTAGWEANASGTSLATVWENPTGKTALQTTASQAFDINDNNLVVGRKGNLGFVKRAN